MGLFDYFKFARPTPIERQSLTSVQRVTHWTEFKDSNQNLNRKDLRKLYMDDEISAATDTRKEACVSTPWLIVGGDETVNTQTWELFKNIIPQILHFSWWAVPYGYSVVQVIWKQEGIRLVPDYVLDQPFESFSINQDGEIKYTSDTGRSIIDHKFFATIRNPSFSSPSGESLYQRLFTAYYYRLNAWEFWIQYLETWGKPFIQAVSDTTDTQTTTFLQTLIGAKRPRGVITDKNVELKVVEGSGSSGTSFKDFEQALSERIQRLILGQTLTSGAGDVGSQALGTVHNMVRDDKRIADCKLLESTIQNILNSYFEINELQGEVPLFQFQHQKGLNTDLASRDAILLTQGVQYTAKYYEENYDLDPEDFNLVPPVSAPNFPFSTSIQSIPIEPKQLTAQKFSVPSEVTAAQIETEKNAIENSENTFSEEEIKIAIQSAKSKKDLEKKLSILMGKDSTKFEDDVTKALLMANVEGFTHGTQGD